MPPKDGLLNNDRYHGFKDPNKGGGPLSVGNAGFSPRHRGGFGSSGQRPAKGPSIGPGKTGSQPRTGGAVVHENPDKRVPDHGGSPQMRGKIPPKRRGGFTHPGQKGVPSGKHSMPPLKAGNTSGRSHKLIAGHFTRKAMGAQPSGSSGSYGGAPVTSNT